MDTINSSLSTDALLAIENQLCEAYDAGNMPLVIELSKKIDAYQLSLWSQPQAYCG